MLCSHSWCPFTQACPLAQRGNWFADPPLSRRMTDPSPLTVLRWTYRSPALLNGQIGWKQTACLFFIRSTRPMENRVTIRLDFTDWIAAGVSGHVTADIHRSIGVNGDSDQVGLKKWQADLIGKPVWKGPLVWSVFNRKAEGLVGRPGISHKEQETFSYKYTVQWEHISNVKCWVYIFFNEGCRFKEIERETWRDGKCNMLK